MCICVRGEGILLQQVCYQLEALHSNLPRSKTIPAVADHLLNVEGKAYMIQKSPSQLLQRIAPRIWEKQDNIKGATQSAQSLPVICTQQGPEMGTDARI